MRNTFAAIILASLCLPLAAQPGPQPVPVKTPSHADVLVARIDDVGKPMDLKADIWLPAKTAAPAPLLLYIHGKGGSYKVRNDRMALLAISLTEKGFAVATIDYRMSGRMPAMLMDTKAYVRYFRAHARDYNIDPNRIGTWGVSRGGNLAAMLAVSGDVKELEGDIGGNTGHSSKINASVIESPLTDMFVNTDEKAASIFNEYLGMTTVESMEVVQAWRKRDMQSARWKDVMRIQQVNPVNYIAKDSPPALIICAGGDTGNVIANCTVMFDKYVEKAADAQYYAWAQGAHVRVGPNIEEASVAWLMDKLGAQVPSSQAASLR
jgi:acetyl esterase/lipase